MSEDQSAKNQGGKVYRFRVRGRVQGVYFRASARAEAQRLGLSGWVANCADGSVTGRAAGEAPQLTAFREWLAHGPPAARVDDLDWQAIAPADGQPSALPEPFAIRPDLAAGED